MATSASLTLTNSNGDTFSLDANKIIMAYNNANSKAVLTYALSAGVNSQPQTLTISTSALQALSTDILFEQDVYEKDTVTFLKTVCFCGSRAIKLVSNITDSNFCDMEYDMNNAPYTQTFTLDGSIATISSQTKTSIPLTDANSNTVYQANGLLVNSISPNTEIGDVLQSAVVVAAGSLMVPASTVLTLVGGTKGVTATVLVATTAVSATTATPVAAGTSYNVGDTVNPDGGTGTKAVFTVTHIKASATLPVIVAAGNGYNVGDKFTANVGGTGTAAVYEVATLTGGAGSGVATITLFSAGDLTVRPTLGVGVATAHTTGTGNDALTVTLVAADFGALTISNTTAGNYTANPTAVTGSATTAVTGTGTGMTISFKMGALTVTVANPGEYSTPPSNPVSTTGGSDTATLTATFAEGAITGCQILFNNPNYSTAEQLNVQETKAQVTALINAL
jgi:hypothetical protein